MVPSPLKIEAPFFTARLLSSPHIPVYFNLPQPPPNSPQKEPLLSNRVHLVLNLNRKTKLKRHSVLAGEKKRGGDRASQICEHVELLANLLPPLPCSSVPSILPWRQSVRPTERPSKAAVLPSIRRPLLRIFLYRRRKRRRRRRSHRRERRGKGQSGSKVS